MPKSSNVKSLVSRYVDSKLYRFDGTYYVEALELKNKVGSSDKEWQPATSIYLSGTGLSGLRAVDPVWGYATVPKRGFNVDNLQGYSKSDINVYNEKIRFTFTVRPYTYMWKNKTTKRFIPSDGKVLLIGEYFFG